MANVKIVATGLTTSLTSAADTVQFLSGALKGSTISTLGGNDTINLIEAPTVSGAGFLAQAGDGADSIHLDGGTYTKSAGPTIFGNGGNDTITFSGGTVGFVYGQDGNDRVATIGSTIANTITLGKNADTLVYSGTISSTLGLGRGHDQVSASTITFGNETASLSLGEGRDTIHATVNAANSAFTILGDAGNGTRAGADSISLILGGGNTTAVSFNAGGGNDTVAFSGATQFASSNIAFGKGNDKVTFEATVSGNNTIGGGAGADTISFGAALAVTARINGGDGNDSITLASLTTTGGGNLTTVAGGDGADTISLGALGFTGGVAQTTFFLSALDESNLANTDTVNFAAAAGTSTGVTYSGSFNFNNSASVITVGSTTGAAIFGNANNYATLADGVVTFAGTLATDVVSSVTAAMAHVDKLTLNSVISDDGEGTAAVFTANSKTYLFMQGGVAGTADDGLVQVNNGTASNLMSLTTNGSAAAINFSGGL